jgi:hypothetical protein
MSLKVTAFPVTYVIEVSDFSLRFDWLDWRLIKKRVASLALVVEAL